MKTKIILASLGVLLTAGVGMHLANYCPLRDAKAHLTHHAATKDVKAPVAVKQ